MERSLKKNLRGKTYEKRLSKNDLKNLQLDKLSRLAQYLRN